MTHAIKHILFKYMYINYAYYQTFIVQIHQLLYACYVSSIDSSITSTTHTNKHILFNYIDYAHTNKDAASSSRVVWNTPYVLIMLLLAPQTTTPSRTCRRKDFRMTSARPAKWWSVKAAAVWRWVGQGGGEAARGRGGDDRRGDRGGGGGGTRRGTIFLLYIMMYIISNYLHYNYVPAGVHIHDNVFMCPCTYVQRHLRIKKLRCHHHDTFVKT